MKTNVNLTITPTLLTVLQEVPSEELDLALRKAFPLVFMTEAERIEHKMQLLEEINAFVPIKPTIGIEEALRRTREDDFPDE